MSLIPTQYCFLRVLWWSQGAPSLDFSVRKAEDFSELNRREHHGSQHVCVSRMLEHSQVLARLVRGVRQAGGHPASCFATGRHRASVSGRVGLLQCCHSNLIVWVSTKPLPCVVSGSRLSWRCTVCRQVCTCFVTCDGLLKLEHRNAQNVLKTVLYFREVLLVFT